VNLDPRTPVIIGVAQVTDRVDDPQVARTPVELMTDALRSAAIDAGAPAVLAGLDLVGAVGGMWRYRDPGRQVATAVGADDAGTLLTGLSGTSPQRLLDHLASNIAAGHLEAAAMVGGEAFRSRRRARRLGVEVRRDADADLEPAERYEGDLDMASDHEMERGVVEPGVVYPLFETAIRHSRGESIADHRNRIGTLWAGFNAVAVDNAHAAVRTPMTAAEITTPSTRNRMVCAPYTKAMMANNSVDQASAVLIVSAARAAALGVSPDRWVFPLVGTKADDEASPGARHDLHRSPAARAAANLMFELAGTGIDDVDHLDLYACFPASVQVCALELGLDIEGPSDRPLTVTGGLTFAGGPHSNSVGQSLAAMVGRLRERPGTGLVYANGGYLGKHAFGLYGTEPPAGGYRTERSEVDRRATPSRTPDPGFAGPATIDGYSVSHDREGRPTRALVSMLTTSGSRVWGGTTQRATLDAMTIEEFVGRPAEMDPDGFVAI
jgi:acetyl-CoA C-acetyltransferase|tara:strand:- start:2593 stop:4077 length:1485 start_codon:yes stop_codon:yes gene_type:complete